MHNKYLILFFISTTLFSQNMWQGNSVSTSDNADPIFLNPAGFGIERQISSVYFPMDDDKNKVLSIKTSDRYKSFGFSTHYIDGDELFNPTDFSIGFGNKISNNLYAGFSWSKKEIITFGLLYRPYNFITTGLTIKSSEDNDDYFSFRSGFGIRPLNSSHILTIGIDYQYDKNNIKYYEYKDDLENLEKKDLNNSYLIPFIDLNLIKGLTISAKSIGYKELNSNIYNFENYTVNLNLNFGKNGFFSQSSHKNKDNGLGFYSSKSIIPSIKNILPKKTKQQKQTWVRLKMEGMFIEEPVKKQGFNFNFSLPFLNSGFQGPVIQLRTWIEKLDNLTKNENIGGLIIDWSYISAGFAKRQEIYNALDRFKKSGKEIIIYSTYGFTNADYYLVSLADEIYIHEDAGIDLRGLNFENTFFRGLFDTLGIVPEFVAISPYKSAIDAFTRKDLSSEVKENVGGLFNSIYEQFAYGISNARGWDLNKTKQIINDGPYGLEDKNLSDVGLITGYKYPDEFETYINNKSISVKKWDKFHKQKYYDYTWTEKNNPKIAIVYAVGSIMPGQSVGGKTGSSTMGDETIRKAIKSAREDKSIDAIVLRIDSPGGSGSASDLIWREIIKTTDEDTLNIKPFIASMSDVAASGGYYIACQADTIVAHPSTITGSIGVLGGRVNLTGLMNKIGISYDRMVFGDNAAFWSNNKLWTDKEKERYKNAIVKFYGKFLTKVVDGRNNALDSLKVDSVGGGRVWTGIDAKEHLLVDEVGGLFDSIEIAKNAAGIDPLQEVDIIEFPRQEPFNFVKLMIEAEQNADLPIPFEDYQELVKLLEVLDSDEILYFMPYNFKLN